MEWHCGGWDNEHFHANLRLPLSSNVSRGIVITLEAMARECVAVAISPNPYFTLGKTYVVHIGANGNLETVIRRRLENGYEAVDAVVGMPNVCRQDKFTPFWVVVFGGKVSVGTGRKPGQQTLGTLDDSMYHALRSGVDAVKYVGLGNSALGRKARDLKVRNVRVMTVPECFDQNTGIPLTPFDPSKNVDDADEKDAQLWEEYRKECEKAKKRALKFGTEYKQPAPDAFFKWSEARRLRANPDKGFITGMDILSTEEKEKARKRKARFDEEDRQNKAKSGEDMDEGTNAEELKGEEDDVRIRKPIPLEQAWDNEDLIKSMRVDPPSALFIVKDTTSNMEEVAIDDSREDKNGDTDEKEATFVPTKIHLFAIDWAAFKQIRTDDIMSFFKAYGPSYCEWLGELSCNVLFEDKYSAARALEALSRALPLEIPLKNQNSNNDVNAVASNEGDQEDGNNAMETSDSSPISTTNLGSMGWRLLNFPVRKTQSDRYGKRGTRSRCLVRVATSSDVLVEKPTSWPKPPPGFTTKRVLGPGSDFKRYRKGGGKRRKRDNSDYHQPDDSGYFQLDDSDYYQPIGGEEDGTGFEATDEFGRSAIDRGLKSSRPGFTVEDMEAERAAGGS